VFGVGPTFIISQNTSPETTVTPAEIKNSKP
jgi:hypothetical protein